ncbi:MAG: hypothetical protein PHE53_05045 [Thermoguttaceae bacterium]|nr:hypothetical protein [Thermoguttaceae bacterium]
MKSATKHVSDPSRLRTVRAIALVVGSVLGVLVGWLLFALISWMFGMGPKEAAIDSEPTAIRTESSSKTGNREGKDDPYRNLAPIQMPVLPAPESSNETQSEPTEVTAKTEPSETPSEQPK